MTDRMYDLICKVSYFTWDMYSPLGIPKSVQYRGKLTKLHVSISNECFRLLGVEFLGLKPHLIGHSICRVMPYIGVPRAHISMNLEDFMGRLMEVMKAGNQKSYEPSAARDYLVRFCACEKNNKNHECTL